MTRIREEEEVVQKWVFRPAGVTHYPDKREIWEYSPQNYQIVAFWS